jgi:bZIP-type transcription factor MBZ1
MLVDNPHLHSSYFAAASAQPSHSEYPTDFSDIFNTDLFNSSFEVSSSTSPASQGSSPKNLLTPPQEVLPTSFPEVYEELFQYDDASPDFMGVNAFDASYGGASAGGVNYNIGYDASNMHMGIPPVDDPIQMSIDPQLVDTPSAATDEPEEEQEPRPEQEKLTFTIAPVKVGGFGKARKGTVQSGGVVKKAPIAYLNKDKENPASTTISSKKLAPPKATKQTPTSLPNTTPVSGLFLTGDKSTYGGSEGGDVDDDDLPQDWRPPPEVLAKMTSKEKRQLRNKISARNFRVRRKGDFLSPSLMT